MIIYFGSYNADVSTVIVHLFNLKVYFLCVFLLWASLYKACLLPVYLFDCLIIYAKFI